MLVERRIHGSRMLLDTQDPGVSKQLFTKGTRESEAPDILEKLVQPGWVCIDLGANIGFYVFIEGKRGAKVYAIEASPRNCRILRKSAALNNYDVEIFNIAMGNKTATSLFTVSQYSNWGYMKEMKAFRPPRLIHRDVPVKERKLDDFVDKHGITHLDLLRFDIDGYEVEMLEGAQKTLKMMEEGSWIFAELHPRCFHNPMEEYKPTMDNLIGHGFKAKHGVGPGKGLIDEEDFAFSCCTKYAPTAPLIFFQKCESAT